MVVSRWAELDPRAAADYIVTNRMENRWEQDYAMSAAASAWSRKDATSAGKWALGLEDPGQRRSAIAGVVVGMAKTEGLPRQIPCPMKTRSLRSGSWSVNG